MPGSLREVAECVLLRPEVQVLMKAVLLGYVRLCPKLLNLSLCLRVAFQNPAFRRRAEQLLLVASRRAEVYFLVDRCEPGSRSQTSGGLPCAMV